MRALIAALGFVLLAVPAFAETIQPADAPAHVGQTVTVEGTVDEVNTDPRSGNTFIDMGGRYPDQAFTAVIFRSDAGSFQDVKSLNGKTVEITGRVRLHKGKPEIILNAASQIKIQ